jgi:rod shape-determining protein MreD
MLILFAIATYMALLFQTAVPLWFPFHALIPNLVIILTVDLGLRHHSALAALMAFAMGYATDALSGNHLGMNAFLTTSIFLVSYEMSSRLLVTNVLVGAIAVFFAVMVAGLGAMIFTAGRGAVEAINLVFAQLLLQALVSAIVAPLVFAAMAGTKRVIGLPDELERE